MVERSLLLIWLQIRVNSHVHHSLGASGAPSPSAQHSSRKGRSSESSSKHPKRRSANSLPKNPPQRSHSLTRSMISETMSLRLRTVEAKITSSAGKQEIQFKSRHGSLKAPVLSTGDAQTKHRGTELVDLTPFPIPLWSSSVPCKPPATSAF